MFFIDNLPDLIDQARHAVFKRDGTVVIDYFAVQTVYIEACTVVEVADTDQQRLLRCPIFLDIVNVADLNLRHISDRIPDRFPDQFAPAQFAQVLPDIPLQVVKLLALNIAIHGGAGILTACGKNHSSILRHLHTNAGLAKCFGADIQLEIGYYVAPVCIV